VGVPYQSSSRNQVIFRGEKIMKYKLSSIDTHADKGFGVTAEAFKEAADRLNDEDFIDDVMAQGEMPVLYLYRHSIELFLKSLIMHIHEELKIPYLKETNNGNHPFILNEKGHVIYIENCHSLKILFHYLCNLIKEHKDSLQSHAPNANWLINGRIRGNMKAINELDDKSDYFRYPISRNQSKDKDKYSIKKIAERDLSKVLNSVQGKMIFATKNKEGEIQDIYMRDQNILKEMFKVLKQTADFFNVFHFMTRMDLCNGW
jgi:hypothetical protein